MKNFKKYSICDKKQKCAFLLIVVFLIAISFDSLHGENGPNGNDSKGNSLVGPVDFHPGVFDRRSKEWLGGQKQKNIRWVARLGTESYGAPVLTGEMLLMATNNAGYLPEKFPATTDLGSLVALERLTGTCRGQFSVEKLHDTELDWPHQGICDNPVLSENPSDVVAWIVTNRSEVVSFRTDFPAENKGTVVEPETIWTFDLIGNLGTVPHQMTACNPVLDRGRLFLQTSNGVGSDDRTLSAPDAPSFIALNAATGELLWSDNPAGDRILDGQWSSPVIVSASAKPDAEPIRQLIFPGGDGRLYAYRIDRDTIEPFWQFDANPKKSVWRPGGIGDRNILMATPVWDPQTGLLIVATGQDPESGEGPAALWGIDLSCATAAADSFQTNSTATPPPHDTTHGAEFVEVSATCVVDSQGAPVLPKRFTACSVAAGEEEIPNLSSAVRWFYGGSDPSSDEFESVFHRTLGTPLIVNGMVIVGDFSGLIHAVDLTDGTLLWTHDAMGAIWASPYAVGNRVYLGTADGDLLLFDATPQGCENVRTIPFGAPIRAAVTFDRGILFVPTARYLFAIDAE